jgi:hypothetical protein
VDENVTSGTRIGEILVFLVRNDTKCAECSTELFRGSIGPFPSRPVKEATRIAEHACRKYSGRVGRSAEAKRFDPEAVRLATCAAVRHRFTNYDDLLLGGMERYEARSVVASAVERKLREWSAIAHID